MRPYQAFVGVLMAAAVSLTSARVSAAQSVSVATRLARQAKVFEPVQFSVTIQNQSGSDIEVDLGWNQTGAFRFELEGPGATKTSARTKAPAFGGLSEVPTVRIPAGKAYSNVILLNEILDLTTAGEYALSIASDATVRDVASKAPLQVDRTWRATVTILPSSDADIRELCDRLSQQAMSLEYSAEGARAARSLTLVKHEIAVPYLLAVSRQGPWAWLTVPALENLPGAAARGALEALAKEGRGEVASMAASALQRRQSRSAP